MKTKKINETSWRTLMLLTTLFIVFVIFQGTVRTPKLPVARAQPLVVVQPPAEPNQLRAKGLPNAASGMGNPEPAPSQPAPVPAPVPAPAEARLVWFNGKLVDRETGWPPGWVPDEQGESSPPAEKDPNEPAPPIE
jgi:hypothetical protein